MVFAAALFSWQLRLIGNRLQILVYLFHWCSSYWSLLCAVASSEVPWNHVVQTAPRPSIPRESLLLHESANLEHVMCTVLWSGFCSRCWFQVQLTVCKMYRLLIKVKTVSLYWLSMALILDTVWLYLCQVGDGYEDTLTEKSTKTNYQG